LGHLFDPISCRTGDGMTISEELIPELALWNDGAGIAAAEWICGEGRADHALGFCALFWPEIRRFEGYVLREPINEEHLRGWESSGTRSRQEIEAAMNAQFLEGVFPADPAPLPLMARQLDRLARIMVDMLTAKLAMAFPDSRFSVFVIDDGDDFAVSFHQV
jgi:hypothetical protein